MNIRKWRFMIIFKELFSIYKCRTGGNFSLARRLNELEKKYDDQFRVVFDAIRELMAPTPEKPKERIGFHP